jgi:hypothetical protein
MNHMTPRETQFARKIGPRRVGSVLMFVVWVRQPPVSLCALSRTSLGKLGRSYCSGMFNAHLIPRLCESTSADLLIFQA